MTKKSRPKPTITLTDEDLLVLGQKSEPKLTPEVLAQFDQLPSVRCHIWYSKATDDLLRRYYGKKEIKGLAEMMSKFLGQPISMYKIETRARDLGLTRIRVRRSSVDARKLTRELAKARSQNAKI